MISLPPVSEAKTKRRQPVHLRTPSSSAVKWISDRGEELPLAGFQVENCGAAIEEANETAIETAIEAATIEATAIEAANETASCWFDK